MIFKLSSLTRLDLDDPNNKKFASFGKSETFANN